jgi:hypothetical protein
VKDGFVIKNVSKQAGLREGKKRAGVEKHG